MTDLSTRITDYKSVADAMEQWAISQNLDLLQCMIGSSIFMGRQIGRVARTPETCVEGVTKHMHLVHATAMQEMAVRK